MFLTLPFTFPFPLQSIAFPLSISFQFIAADRHQLMTKTVRFGRQSLDIRVVLSGFVAIFGWQTGRLLLHCLRLLLL